MRCAGTVVHYSDCDQPCRQRTIPKLYTENDTPQTRENMAANIRKPTCSPLFIFRTVIILSCFFLVAATERNVEGKCNEITVIISQKKQNHMAPKL